MAEFASNAKANTGLALSGTSLGFSLLGGGLSWLLGGNRMMNGGCCNEDHLINRYELQKEQRITSLETENALLKSNIYTDQKSIELYRYIDGKFNTLEQAINQQAVYNATNNSTLACMQQQIACLQSLTKVVIPATSVCPEPMNRYNSWTAPTTPAPAAEE